MVWFIWLVACVVLGFGGCGAVGCLSNCGFAFWVVRVFGCGGFVGVVSLGVL